ncbi:MAG: outer membrane protein [Crocinitomix sp.]|jgi:outer membrane protein
MENKGSSLAKISLGINVVLIIAVIILFVKMPSGAGTNEVVGGNDSTNNVTPVIPDDGTMKICYFHADSLNSLDMMGELEAMGEEAQKKAESRMRGKENEIQKWQEGWGDPSALLPSEMRNYQEEAMKKEQEIGMFQQQVQMDLAREQEGLMLTLITRVSDASKTFAEENGYDFVLSYQKGQMIYYGSPNFDVTAQLTEMINSDYRGNQETLTDGENADEAGAGE